MAEVLNTLPMLDNQFRHLVPPAVRQMGEELKQMLQQQIQSEFTKIQTCNEQLTTFLRQLGLPMSIQTLTTSREIPNELWAKIEDFQKKGADQNFAMSIQGNQTIIQINNDMIADMESTLNSEEQEDNQLRQQYGPKFNRMPSPSVNQPYRQSISDYKQKLA